MKARIRYYAVDKGWLQSTRSFPSKAKGELRAYIHPELNKFKIADNTSGAVVVEGSGVNGHDVKKQVKSTLRELGVAFAPESRMRGADELWDAIKDDI